MDMLDIFKEHYFFEINRKHQLTSALALPIGLLTVFGGVVVYYLKHFVLNGSFIPVLYSTLVVVAIFFMSKTIYYLIRSYHNFTYSYISTPDELLEYHKSLIDHYTIYENDPEKADDVFMDNLKMKYSKCTSQNTWNNDSKSSYLHEANSNLIYTLIVIMICGIPYLYLENGNTSKAQKVEIVGLEKILNKGD